MLFAWICTTVDKMSSISIALWLTFILSSLFFWKYSNFRKYERQWNEPLYTFHQGLSSWERPFHSLSLSHMHIPPPTAPAFFFFFAEPFQTKRWIFKYFNVLFIRIRKDSNHNPIVTPNSIKININIQIIPGSKGCL